MSIIRIGRKTQNFAVLDKAFLENKTLSWKAKGMLAYLLSRPEDWHVMAKQLTTCSTDGRDANYSALKELEVAGYILRNKLKDAAGRIKEFEYVVFEKPQIVAPETPLTENPEVDKSGENTNVSPLTGFPYLENPDTVFPDLDNPSLLNRDITKNDKTKDRQDMSVRPLSLDERIVEESLTQGQLSKVDGLIAMLQKEGRALDMQALKAQITHSLLNKEYFSKAGADFQYRLNIISKLIRSGQWECPVELKSQPAMPSKINEYAQQIKSLKSKISAERATLNSNQTALTSVIGQDPKYRAGFEAKIQESKNKLAVLGLELETL